MNNFEYLNDKNMFPQTAPDQQGRTRKLSIEPNTFGDDCETMEFKYVAGKGEFLTFNCDQTTFEEIITELEQVLRRREVKEPVAFTQTFKNKPASYLYVGRKEDGTPFMAIKATIKSGQERSKEFFFPRPKNMQILRNGQPISDLESQERRAMGFVRRAKKLLDRLEADYKPRVYNPQGGGYGAQGGQGQSGYGGQGSQSNYAKPPEASQEDFDNMF